MDLMFPLKPHSVILKAPPSSSLLFPLPLRFRAASAFKHANIQCELDGRLNDALSGDFDTRFLDRQKALEAAMNDINNSFGKGSVTRLGSAGGALVETFPSGCLTLDCALGGGLPKGRIVEIFGPESSGKTTLALHAIAEVQKLGGNAMLVDAEHAFDPAYSKALGVDVENLIVCQPDHGEMALENRMCRSGAIDLICVDSVSALTPRAEIEGEIGMQQMGLQARLMSQALRKMSGNASKAGCTLVFLNQIRYKIGVYYGNPEVTSGGIALKFFASLRLEVRPTGKIKSAKGDEEIGLKVRVRVQKSKSFALPVSCASVADRHRPSLAATVDRSQLPPSIAAVCRRLPPSAVDRCR
ncbi:DNA repair protein recA-like 1, chloroplastic [Mucuna pruriens]|uniref:DNA repair protein recA-like 1, chloroplastic n=1 Tax=Mucuna pruriens TaxID=157652 RepID=A0A371H040_MUCPR|nr:DNA repair protein recA-like 1, chloroplastic [Mucuna pruriens]